MKTTLAKQPQIVRITSERQLDEPGIPALFLLVIALDLREGTGETLLDLVASLRVRLADDPAQRERFEDMLLAAGYLDSHAARYADLGYRVRSEKLFQVREGFSRLTERDLPAGVGDASYGLSVAACQPYAVGLSELKRVLTQEGAGPGKGEA